MRESINLFLSQASSSEERFDHIDQKDKDAVIEKAATLQQWLDDLVARQAEKPKNVDPILTSKEVLKRRDDLIYFANPIFNKPRPQAKTADATPNTQTPPTGQDTPKDGTQTPANEAPNEPTEMDVD